MGHVLQSLCRFCRVQPHSTFLLRQLHQLSGGDGPKAVEKGTGISLGGGTSQNRKEKKITKMDTYVYYGISKVHDTVDTGSGLATADPNPISQKRKEKKLQWAQRAVQIV